MALKLLVGVNLTDATHVEETEFGLVLTAPLALTLTLVDFVGCG